VIFIKIESILEKISFPRFSGTSGEKTAANYISIFLRKNGYSLSEEKFYAPNPRLNNVFLVIKLLLLSLISFSFFSNALLLVILFASIFIVLKIFDNNLKLKISKIRSKNILAFKKTRKNKKILLIAAHYDSANAMRPFLRKNLAFIQLFFLLLRVFQYCIFILIPTIFVVYVFHFQFLLGILQSFSFIWIIIGSALVFISVAMIFLMISSKQILTAGADDNASGISILLYLSQLVEKMKLNLDVRFLFLSAEEIGCYGSKEWIKRHADLSRSAIVLNIDAMSRGDYFVITRGWNYLFKIHANNTLIETLKAVLHGKKYFETWNMSFGSDDHIFAKNGFATIGVMRANKKQFNSLDKFLLNFFRVPLKNNFLPSAEWINTENDDLENVDFKKLNESKNVVLRLLQRLDQLTVAT